MFVLRNARLIPQLTEGFEGTTADVVMEGRLIDSIRPAGSVSADCEGLDLAGKTLLPGLFDLHMHMYFASDDFAAEALRSQNENVLHAVSYANEFLKQGFTTIRDCGNPHYIGIAVRDAVAAGLISGPRILTAGRCLSPFAKSNDTFPHLYWEVNTPDEVKAACRYEYAQGVDFIKYMATGSVANLNGEPGALISSREEIFALQAAAEAMGTYAGVHCHGKEGLLYCAQAGIRTIEPASMIDEDCIEEILKQNGKTNIIPTLDPVVQIHRGDDNMMPPIIKEKIDIIYAHTQQLVTATRAGVLTGWGTDMSAGFFTANPGYEFDARREIGYTNMEMLQQATINSAKIVGLADKLGTVKAGKLANLVVIDGKPDENISAMMHHPAAVFKEGTRCF